MKSFALCKQTLSFYFCRPPKNQSVLKYFYSSHFHLGFFCSLFTPWYVQMLDSILYNRIACSTYLNIIRRIFLLIVLLFPILEH